jgi:hypothetical protein
MVSIAISHHAPYQGGYIDFIPVKDTSHSNYTGPPRTSLFDDLIYYHNLPNPAPTSLPTPDTAVYFLKKIIAGIWMNSIAYVGTSVSSLEYAVEQSRKHSPSSPPIDGKTTSYGGLEWLEKNLFHIYAGNEDALSCMIGQIGTSSSWTSHFHSSKKVAVPTRLPQILTNKTGYLSRNDLSCAKRAAGTLSPLHLASSLLSRATSPSRRQSLLVCLHSWVLFTYPYR